MKNKKALLAAAMLLMLTGCGEKEELSIDGSGEETPAFAEYNVASLKGPTSMGMVKLMAENEINNSFNNYNFSLHGTADEVVAGIVSGETDIANIPANLAAVLYKKTEGNICVSNINTLGVLYLVSSGEEISSVADLKGKTVYSTGKSTTPEYVFNHILRQNGLEPQTDVIIEYKSEAAEAAAVLAETENALAVLPQPYVASAMAQNDKLKIVMSLDEEWNKISSTPMVTGVTVAQKSIISENPVAFGEFLNEYEASVKYVNQNTETAASMCEDYGIIKKGPALAALPYCNISFIRGEEMKNAVSGYWNVLFEADPKAVGGQMPDEGAFFINNEQ